MRFSRWLVVAISLFIAWLVVGVVTVRYPRLGVFAPHPLVFSTHHQLVIPPQPNLLPYQILGFVAETVGYLIPALSGIGLIWAAFVRPQWSERALFSAALIVSAMFFLWSVPQALFGFFFHRSYGNNWAMIGTVAYVPWLFMARASRRPVAVALCAVALLVCFVSPVLIGYVDDFAAFGATSLDVIGGGLLGGALVAMGLAVAEKVGAQVFSGPNDT